MLYIYIYIERERERGRGGETPFGAQQKHRGSKEEGVGLVPEGASATGKRVSVSVFLMFPRARLSTILHPTSSHATSAESAEKAEPCVRKRNFTDLSGQ
ncbi:hypothetical protein J4Q44_G00211070 [Coregonus suidteri]|uniref:Uncharacterized protein n=1 Tax=Coregonus suidteri TaxID=861788 RepID=A0AAN8QQ97_9TELE